MKRNKSRLAKQAGLVISFSTRGKDEESCGK